MARERISVDPHQRSRRRQQPGGGKRFMPVIIGLLMLLVFAGAAGGYIYEKKYAPTKELADQADYFGVSGDEVTIYLDDEQQADENGKLVLAKCVNGGVFLREMLREGDDIYFIGITFFHRLHIGFRRRAGGFRSDR